MSGRLSKGTRILLSKFDFTKLPCDNQLKGFKGFTSRERNSMPEWVSWELKQYTTCHLYRVPQN